MVVSTTTRKIAQEQILTGIALGVDVQSAICAAWAAESVASRALVVENYLKVSASSGFRKENKAYLTAEQADLVKRAVQAGNVSEGATATAVRNAAGDLLSLCTGALWESGGADGDGRGDDDGEDGLHFGEKRVT